MKNTLEIHPGRWPQRVRLGALLNYLFGIFTDSEDGSLQALFTDSEDGTIQQIIIDTEDR